jgi:hypothetical protein
MSADRIVRLDPRRERAVWLSRDREGAWLVLDRDHGWLHGDYSSALEDALWLSENLGLAVRNQSEPPTW